MRNRVLIGLHFVEKPLGLHHIDHDLARGLTQFAFQRGDRFLVSRPIR